MNDDDPDRTNLIVNYLPSSLTDDDLLVGMYVDLPPLSTLPTYLPTNLGGYLSIYPPTYPVRSITQVSHLLTYLPTYLPIYVPQALFKEYGEISSCRVIKERGSFKSLGYGFVKVGR